jgi:autotransporter-associated beta strand protein
MNPGTNLLFWGSTNTKEGTINLNSARIENARDVVNNTLNGPLNINGGGNEINVFFNTNPNEGALGDQTLLVSGILGGSGTFNKTGEGTLVLSNNANTFSGTMNINQGTVRIDSASAIPAAAAVRVVSGATLRLGVDAQLNNIRSGGTVALQDDFGTPRNLTVAGTTTSVLAGLVGGGSLIKSGTGTLVLTGSNAHTGGITVNSGTVEVASDSALGGNTVAVQSGSTIAFSNAGLLEYTDSLAAAEAGNDAFVPPAPTGTATAVRDISGGDRNSVPENTRYYYSGKLTNPSAAPVTYTFAEQYDDDVFIRIGQQSGVDLAVPLINNNTWNAATQGQVTLAPGESQDVVIAMRNGVFGAGASSDGTGTNVDPDWFIYGIGFRTDIPEGGVIPAAQAGYSPVSVDNGLAFSTGQNRTINNAFVLNGSATMTTATMNGGAKATITGVISGSGSLVKAGAGELELNAANTFTGGAQVDAGTLHVVASASLASGVTVNSGGTLMGSGTIDGNVVVNSGGFLTPGASPGALTLVNDDLSLLNGSTTVFEVGGIITSLYDRILGINQITLDGNIQVTLFGGFTPSNGNSFDLFDATTVNSVGFNLATELQLPVLGDGLSWDTGQFLSQGILTVVPEPTSGAALTLGSAVFLGWRRRRQS